MRIDWKDKSIILTDHVIEEYYNDHKGTTNRADVMLRNKFRMLLDKRKKKELHEWNFK